MIQEPAGQVPESMPSGNSGEVIADKDDVEAPPVPEKDESAQALSTELLQPLDPAPARISVQPAAVASIRLSLVRLALIRVGLDEPEQQEPAGQVPESMPSGNSGEVIADKDDVEASSMASSSWTTASFSLSVSILTRRCSRPGKDDPDRLECSATSRLWTDA
jgi:hypothetical protein